MKEPENMRKYINIQMEMKENMRTKYITIIIEKGWFLMHIQIHSLLFNSLPKGSFFLEYKGSFLVLRTVRNVMVLRWGKEQESFYREKKRGYIKSILGTKGIKVEHLMHTFFFFISSIFFFSHIKKHYHCRKFVENKERILSWIPSISFFVSQVY